MPWGFESSPTACDLPDDLIERNGIEVVPLTIRFGNEELIDRKELSTDEFWRRLADSDVLPETSAPSAGAFEGAFRRLVEDGATGIICINLSSKLSATMQSAPGRGAGGPGRLPGRRHRLAHGLDGPRSLCLTAAQRAAGRGFARVDRGQRHRPANRSKLYGALDTLEFLKKGGRVGNARALLGTMLAIKPVLEVRDGVVEEAGKVRTVRRLAPPGRPREGRPVREPGGAPAMRRMSTSSSICSSRWRPGPDRRRPDRSGHRHPRRSRHRRHVPGRQLTSSPAAAPAVRRGETSN